MTRRTGRPVSIGLNGMVSSPHPAASVAGLEVLKAGGSAIDAAIAANAVLTVVLPDQTSIGGDCFLQYFDAKAGRTFGLNGSGRSPRAADREALVAAGHDEIPVRSVHAVTVPGTIDAWWQAHQRWGRHGFAQLLQPAIAYAREGFAVQPNLAAALAKAWPDADLSDAFRQVYFPGGRPPLTGERLQLPALGVTLARIAAEGPACFYTGAVADDIVATSRKLGGRLVHEDLAQHAGEWVDPVVTTYRGTGVLELPPNSQGITASIALNLLGIDDAPQFGTVAHIHRMAEAKKLAFSVRDTITDPAFHQIDTGTLTSQAFAEELWQEFDPDRAAAGTLTRTGDTVYLCAVDKDGNAASMIQSIYLAFGSGILAGESGVLLQCRGAYFSLDEHHPNRLEGGKRTLHTLMPGMLLRDGELVGPFGSEGGDSQAQVHMQLVSNLVDYGMNPQEAIEAPRWISGARLSPDPLLLRLEDGFDPAVGEGLAALGHHIEWNEMFDSTFGQAHMIMRDQQTGAWLGAADPRADGCALGF